MATTRTGNILWIWAEKLALGLRALQSTKLATVTRSTVMSRTLDPIIKHTGATSENKSASATSQTMKAIRIHNYGVPEVLHYEGAPRPQPQAAADLLLRHTAPARP